MDSLSTDVNVASLINVPVANWRPTLMRECNVYIFEEGYIAKPFNQIHYKFVNKDEAKEILIDNLYALMRIKYFKKISTNIDDYIKQVISNFTNNLQTTLQKISFNQDDDCEIKQFLPDYCIAFRNGVFNFKDNKWLFKYDVYSLDFNSVKVYQYDYDYIITWYINIDFKPIDFPATMKDLFELYRKKPTLCFKLLYNMSFNITHSFSYDRFIHLCEILGYTMLQSFCEKFVYLIGTGWNGKNSLFDGCFIDRLIPKPSTLDLQTIEQEKYITSILLNKHLNIMLESSARSVRESKNIKSLTGTMYQTIISKKKIYEGMINCKFVFSANNKEKIRFSDNTDGFKRRINIMQFYYQWNADRSYLKKGNYYDIEFSNSLNQLKNDPENIMTYILFGLYATKLATNNFTKQFDFSLNDWNNSLISDYIDFEKQISNISLTDISNLLMINKDLYYKGKFSFCDLNTHSIDFNKICGSYDNFLQDLKKHNNIFNGQTIYIAVWIIRELQFNNITRLSDLLNKHNIKTIPLIHKYKYIKVKIENDRLKVV